MTASSANKLSSSLTTIQALVLVLAVPALICIAYVSLTILFQWLSVCLTGNIFSYCMKSWSFPFSDQRIQSFQLEMKTILAFFSITATVAFVQCLLTAFPLAYYLSQGIVKNAQRSWWFYTIVGGLVAMFPWSVFLIIYGNNGQPAPALLLLFAIGAVAGLTTKSLLLRKAARNRAVSEQVLNK